MDIVLVGSCFDPYQYDRRIQARQYNGTWAYRVFIYLHGNQIPYVVSVQYHLPSNFQPAYVHIARSIYNPSCRQLLWSYSDFSVSASLTFNNGATSLITANISIANEIRAHQSAVDVIP